MFETLHSVSGLEKGQNIHLPGVNKTFNSPFNIPQNKGKVSNAAQKGKESLQRETFYTERFISMDESIQ
jgi:hypothetical protein